jgi:hypothetical protein
MDTRPEVRRLLHDVQSKCASLKSASLMLKDCQNSEAAEMLSLMTEEARQILKCLFDLRKETDGRPETPQDR